MTHTFKEVNTMVLLSHHSYIWMSAGKSSWPLISVGYSSPHWAGQSLALLIPPVCSGSCLFGLLAVSNDSLYTRTDNWLLLSCHVTWVCRHDSHCRSLAISCTDPCTRSAAAKFVDKNPTIYIHISIWQFALAYHSTWNTIETLLLLTLYQPMTHRCIMVSP